MAFIVTVNTRIASFPLTINYPSLFFHFQI